MAIPQVVIELMKSLNANSVKDRYNFLLEFFVSHPGVFTDDQKQELINEYKAARDKKTEQGKQDAAKRWFKKHSVEKGDWLFIEKSRYGSRCKKCNERYEINDAVFVSKADSKGFHIGCAPEDAKVDNVYYQQYIEKEGSDEKE